MRKIISITRCFSFTVYVPYNREKLCVNRENRHQKSTIFSPLVFHRLRPHELVVPAPTVGICPGQMWEGVRDTSGKLSGTSWFLIHLAVHCTEGVRDIIANPFGTRLVELPWVLPTASATDRATGVFECVAGRKQTSNVGHAAKNHPNPFIEVNCEMDLVCCNYIVT